jgi:hypothetical protein
LPRPPILLFGSLGIASQRSNVLPLEFIQRFSILGLPFHPAVCRSSH